jgi:hypothetical protein
MPGTVGGSLAPTVATPGTETDPFSRSFWANKTAIEFSEQKALSDAQHGRRMANANAEYNRGIDARAEPLKLTANRNTANSQGLAESGVLAKTQGQTQVDYAQKGQRIQEARRGAVEKYNENEANARTTAAIETGKNVASDEEKQVTYNEENPPPPPTPGPGVAPANPATPASRGATRTVLGPAGPGGVVPFQESGPRGFVRVGAPRVAAARTARPVRDVRANAIKKAVWGGVG